MVAFIKTLPNLTANQYTMLTARFDPAIMEGMDSMMDDSMAESMDGMSGDMQH